MINHESTSYNDVLTANVAPLNFMKEELSCEEATHLLEEVIEGLKALYRRQYLIQWERDHSTSKSAFDQRIEHLNKLKEQQKQLIDELSQDSGQIKLEGLFHISCS
ncbi:hypothetical protein [Marinoscillum sp.]|uniref:hypothetical protein n=1 Tax=Marinoscillum sp. TaxID=2024838 RepID=UPI003BACD4AE